MLLVGVAFVAYWPALQGGFVFDDDTLLTQNALIRAPDGLYRFWFTSDPVDYWPMTMSSFWVEWRLWGMDPVGYHVANLLLHIGSALLLWAILKQLRVSGAYWAAFLFTVHPVNVESVAWIAQRKNTLSMIFFLASIYWFLKSRWAASTPIRRSPTPIWRPDFAYWLSLLAFVLAMLSKGSVAILPLVLLGLIAWRRRLQIADFFRAFPFFAVAGILTLVNIQFQNHGLTAPIREIGPVGRLLQAGATVWFYLYKTLLPVNLAFFYPLWHIQEGDVLWWLPLIAAIGLTGLLWIKSGGVFLRPLEADSGRQFSDRRLARAENWRGALFAWGYFCVALIPVMGFTDIYFMKYSLVADHYQYLAVVGILAWVAAIWWDGPVFAPLNAGLRHEKLADGNAMEEGEWIINFRFISAAAVIALLAVLTWRQTRMYHDAETLYRVTLQRDPQSWPAYGNLGVIEAESSRTDAAFGHFAEALRLNPDYAQAHYNLGRLLKPRPNGSALALPHFARAVELSPNYADAHFWLALCLGDLDRPDEARAQFEQSIRLNTFFLFDAENDLAVNLAKAGRMAEALPHFEDAVRLRPEVALVHYMLAEDLAQLGRGREADAQYAQAARLDPRLIRPPVER